MVTVEVSKNVPSQKEFSLKNGFLNGGQIAALGGRLQSETFMGASV